mmetsp:Transcript_14281/g.24393  ORF Transcript_14281/g.24393 Transcript_14281/m.24393 type:complete len:107 (+) Transcript_14281:736-1056(+)
MLAFPPPAQSISNLFVQLQRQPNSHSGMILRIHMPSASRVPLNRPTLRSNSFCDERTKHARTLRTALLTSSQVIPMHIDANCLLHSLPPDPALALALRTSSNVFSL